MQAPLTSTADADRMLDRAGDSLQRIAGSRVTNSILRRTPDGVALSIGFLEPVCELRE